MNAESNHPPPPRLGSAARRWLRLTLRLPAQRRRVAAGQAELGAAIAAGQPEPAAAFLAEPLAAYRVAADRLAAERGGSPVGWLRRRRFRRERAAAVGALGGWGLGLSLADPVVAAARIGLEVALADVRAATAARQSAAADVRAATEAHRAAAAARLGALRRVVRGGAARVARAVLAVVTVVLAGLRLVGRGMATAAAAAGAMVMAGCRGIAAGARATGRAGHEAWLGHRAAAARRRAARVERRQAARSPEPSPDELAGRAAAAGADGQRGPGSAGVASPAVRTVPIARRRRPSLLRVGTGLTVLVATSLAAGMVLAVPAGLLVRREVQRAEAALPDLSRLRPLAEPQTSTVYDSQGNVLAVLHTNQDRTVVPLSQVPRVLQHAVLAAEDARFYSEQGVDLRSIARAAIEDLLHGQAIQGASTIYQQYIRNTYPDLTERTFERKLKEAVLAVQLSRTMSHADILEGYLNRVYFGSGYYGVQAATEGYFGHSVTRITLAEAATLAGIIRAPDGADPRYDPQDAHALRDVVLGNMLHLHMISAAQARAAARAKLVLVPPKPEVRAYPYFVQAVIGSLLADPRLGATYDDRFNEVFGGGLKIYTTLDPVLQQEAEAAAAAHRPAIPPAAGTRYCRHPRPASQAWVTICTAPDIALVSIDPRSGEIKALVGGRNFRTSQYNLATEAHRQAGSSFKTFTLAAALNDGISPQSVWNGVPWPNGPTQDICGTPVPQLRNAEGGGSPAQTLRQATWFSVDAVYMRVVGKICMSRVADMAHRLGVVSPLYDRNCGRNALTGRRYCVTSIAPSITLGTYGVTPLEMADAYATLADEGIWHAPMFVTKIVRPDGSVLLRNSPVGHRRISQALAYAVIDVLKGVVQYGTGTAANIGRPEAGKTGTANNEDNAWFVGFTPALTTAVWTGYPAGNFPMVVPGVGAVFGGTIPAETWHDFMLAALATVPPTDWTPPAQPLTYSLMPGLPPTTLLPPTTTTTTKGKPPTTSSRPPTTVPPPHHRHHRR